MGHMDQQRQGARSTKSTKKVEPDPIEPVPRIESNDHCHHVYMTTAEVEGKLYSNQTGQFPISSNRGNSIIVMFYAVDSNYIKYYPIKSCHRPQLVKAYNEVYSYVRVQGYQSQLHTQIMRRRATSMNSLPKKSKSPVHTCRHPPHQHCRT